MALEPVIMQTTRVLNMGTGGEGKTMGLALMAKNILKK